MSRSVYDEEAWEFHFYIESLLVQFGHFLLELCSREKRGSDLLGDSALLSILDFGLSDVIEDFGFACVDVSHDADDWTSEF